MASTYTTNLGIEKIQTGQQAGQWGDTTNTNFDIIDQAVNGIVTVTLTSAGTSGSPNDIPITDGAESDGRNKFIRLYSASDLGGTVYVRITPSDAEKIVHIRNDLNTQNAVIFQGNYDAGRSIGVTNGRDVLLKFDGGGDSSATVEDVNNDLGVTKITAATVDINGGNIDGTTIGGTTAAAGTFSSMTATTADINGGTIDGATIGGTSAGAGTFTNITASGTLSFPDNSISGDDIDGGTISNFASTGIDDNATGTRLTVNEDAGAGTTEARVGIGETSPAYELHVSSARTQGPTIALECTNPTDQSARLRFGTDSSLSYSSGQIGGLTLQHNGAKLLFKNNQSSTIALTGTFTGFTSTGIDDNATETAVTIDANENVGIGTTSPSADLHVYEAANLGIASASLKVEAQNTTYPTASLTVTANNSSDIVLQCSTTGTTIVQFENLPTSDPSVAGQVWNDSGTLKISAG